MPKATTNPLAQLSQVLQHNPSRRPITYDRWSLNNPKFKDIVQDTCISAGLSASAVNGLHRGQHGSELTVQIEHNHGLGGNAKYHQNDRSDRLEFTLPGDGQTQGSKAISIQNTHDPNHPDNIIHIAPDASKLGQPGFDQIQVNLGQANKDWQSGWVTLTSKNYTQYEKLITSMVSALTKTEQYQAHCNFPLSSDGQTTGKQ